MSRSAGDEPRAATNGPSDESAGAEARRLDAAHRRELQRRRWARVAKALTLLLIGVLFIVFVLRNANPVEVDFVFFTRHPRMIWVMLGCALLGGIAGYLVGRPARRIRFHDRDQPEGR